jgi:hypothetical protein
LGDHGVAISDGAGRSDWTSFEAVFDARRRDPGLKVVLTCVKLNRTQD